MMINIKPDFRITYANADDPVEYNYNSNGTKV